MAREYKKLPARRVVVALRPEDDTLIDTLRAAGAMILHCPPETFDETVLSDRGAAVVADVDLPGTLAAIHRLRRASGPLAMVPIVVIGATHEKASSIHPAMQAGADVFLQRPVNPHDLAGQLETLFEGVGLSPRSMRITGRMTISPKTHSSPPPSAQGREGRPPSNGGLPAAQARGEHAPRTGSSSQIPVYTGASIMPGSAGSPVRGAKTTPTPSTHPAGLEPVAPSSPHPTLPAQARISSPAEPLGAIPPLPPADVATSLRLSLQEAMGAEGIDGQGFELPPLGDDALDDLVPPELLEPLDAPMEPLGDEVPFEVTNSSWGAHASIGGVITGRRSQAQRVTGPTGSSPMPLTIDGDLRLAGVLGRFGVAQLFSAAWRARATGVIVLHSGDTEWVLAVNAGHLLAVRGSRPEDSIGATLARLGYIPREAARFAQVPLDAGLRGAALLAARGYVPPDGLAPILARAAQEMVFDLLCLDGAEWELRALEHSVGVPLPTRALDALLLLGARARLEPAQAYLALGGDDTSVTLRAEVSALAALPLSPAERDAAVAAKGASLASIVRSHGEAVLPALLALSWLQVVRLEGPAHDMESTLAPPGPERTRMRTLLEAADRRDLLALLGVSAWATRRAAQLALDTRRAEVDVLRARYGLSEALHPIYAALDEAAQLLGDVGAWERYASALRSALREEG